MGGRISRRELLRNSGGTIGALGIVGTAGCLDGLPGLSNSPPEYTRWIPARRDDEDYLPSFFFHVAKVPDWLEYAENHQHFDREPADGIYGQTITWGDLNLLIESARPWVRVLTGEFERSEVVETLDESPTGTYNGYTLFVDDRINRIDTAVRDGTIVHTRSHLREAVDAAVGDGERIISRDQTFANLITRLDSGSNVWAWSNRDYAIDMDQANPVGDGRTATFSESPWEYRLVLLFENADTFSLDEFENTNWFERHKSRPWNTISAVKKDGRAVIIEGTSTNERVNPVL